MARLSDWLIFYLFHQRRLTKAAGVSKVTLVCHPDTWDEVIGMSSMQKISLKVDGDVVKRDDALVEVPLSGVSLVGILQITRNIWWTLADVNLTYTHKYAPHDRAIALRVYLAIARFLGKVQSYEAHGAPLPAIVIDDRQRPGEPS